MIILSNDSIEKLTTLLGLSATGQEQDWEVELADPTRIAEFLKVYRNSSLTQDDRKALMALILASADSHIQTGLGVPVEWEQISALLIEERHIHEETIRYWAREGEDEPDAWFDVTPLIRRLVT